jgi:hypothetical protein
LPRPYKPGLFLWTAPTACYDDVAARGSTLLVSPHAVYANFAPGIPGGFFVPLTGTRGCPISWRKSFLDEDTPILRARMVERIDDTADTSLQHSANRVQIMQKLCTRT